MHDRIASEAELIQAFLAPLAAGAPGAFGLRDDAALLTVEPGMDMVVTNDPIVAGVHFFADDRADDIAWKALAVNMSDLAAKAARPIAYTLALGFPEAPERAWMTNFAQGLRTAQEVFGCHLIGGDTDRTSGPLSIGVAAIGVVPKGEFVTRSGAKAGDRIFVTGTLGDSALGLRLHREPNLLTFALTEGEKAFLVGRYLRPSPRLALAPALREFASAALDISDGLIKDLVRLADGRGATIAFPRLPLSPSTRAALASDARILNWVLSGGDDYEILAAVRPESAREFAAKALSHGVQVTEIGSLHDADGVSVVDAAGRPIEIDNLGYDHFAVGDAV